MARSASQYRDYLKALLPPGLAFPRDRGTRIDTLLDGMAQELERIDARGEALVAEALPSSTTELLPDWERVAGLPDNCSGLLGETLAARRADLIAKLTSIGGQSIQYFIDVAAALGYTITIEEFRPFRAGISVAGDPLTNDDWAFTWRINAPPVTVTLFRAGEGSAGEPLASWGNAALECRMVGLKPAHTIVIFAYGADLLLLVEGDGALLLED